MNNRWLDRLANALFLWSVQTSKQVIAMHFGYCNLVNTHKTIKCTSAMGAGKADTYWLCGI